MSYPERVTEHLRVCTEVLVHPTLVRGTIVLINTTDNTDAPYLVQIGEDKIWLSANDFAASYLRSWRK